MSRRRTLSWWLALLALSLLLVPAVSAQQTGGTLVVAAESMGDSLENGLWSGFGTVNVLDNIGEGLVRSDFVSGEPTPGLAESWTISEDGLTYVFTLRGGLTFHDGTPVTAEAVVRSLTRDSNESDPAYIAGMYMFPGHGTTNWESLTATDASTVTLVLKTPDATQLHRLARPSAYILSPAALDAQGANIGTAPVMAGPFRLERFVPGQEAVLAAFDGYWAGRPFLDQIIIRAFPDEASILAALEAGEVQFTTNAPFLSVPRLQQSDNIRVEVGPALVDLFIGANVADEVTGNRDIRLAVNYAINRDNIILAGLNGFGELPASILSPTDLGFDESGRSISTYNPDLAREHIAKSGLATPIAIELAYENNRFWPVLAELVKADLEAVGFTVTLAGLDSGSFWGKVADGDIQLSINQRSTFVPDPNDKTSILHSVNSPGGQTRHELLPTAAEMDALLDAALQATDSATRVELYRQIQALALAEMPYIYLAYLTPPVFVADSVQGVPVGAAAAGRATLREVYLSN
ncbi:MAG: ABC transporter substrate-binding protein [Anaerolineae bacterium]|nr:ABC transporter substrate-binding protein [Anaerolineae bacterium]